jgi:hypothetical protein
VRWSDVEIDAENETVKTRRAMEAAFSSPRQNSITAASGSIAPA